MSPKNIESIPETSNQRGPVTAPAEPILLAF